MESELEEAKKQLKDLKQNQLSFIDEEDYPGDNNLLHMIENEFKRDAKAIDIVLNKLENDEKIIDYIFKQVDLVGADCTDLAIRVEREHQQCRKNNSFNCSQCMKNYIENITKECKKGNEENCEKKN